jgi:hypothetical protein
MIINHINLGTYLSKRFESRYSIIRRILSVNSGIPYSYILSTIRDMPETTLNPNSPLQKAILDDIKKISTSSQSHLYKQCSVCAKNLYHSDLYNLDWLEYCPIHNSKLTKSCPTCKEKWPELKELASRKCITCGLQNILSLSESHKHWKKFSTNKLEPVAKVLETEDISLTTRLNTVFREELLKKNWWVRPSESDLFFYTCQFKEQTKQIQSKLIDIQPNLLDIRRKDFKFTSYCKSSLNNQSKKQSNTTIKELALKAFNDQLSWIDNRQKGSHEISILDYRFLSAEHFSYMSNPCEYCLSISLWFFKIASFLSGDYFYCHGGRYPFLEAVGLSDLFTVHEPDLIIDQDIKSLDQSFQHWFLLRNYKINFILLLTFMKHFQGQVDTWRKSYKIYSAAYKPTTCGCQKHMISQGNGTCRIYFQDDDPLDKFNPKLSNTTKIKCSQHKADFIKITKDFHVNSDQVGDKKSTPLLTYNTGQSAITMQQFELILKEYQARQIGINNRGRECIANNKYTYWMHQ